VGATGTGGLAAAGKSGAGPSRSTSIGHGDRSTGGAVSRGAPAGVAAAVTGAAIVPAPPPRQGCVAAASANPAATMVIATLTIRQAAMTTEKPSIVVPCACAARASPMRFLRVVGTPRPFDRCDGSAIIARA
jgi:hypothetical protein